MRAAGGQQAGEGRLRARAPSSTRPSGRSRTSSSAESTARAAQAKRAATAARALARAQHKSPAQVRRYGEQAKQLVEAEFAKNVIALALKYGIRSAPQLNDPAFVSKIVFDDTKGPGVPKGRFAYIFPNKSSALIQVRFRSDLSEGAARPRDRARAPGRRHARVEAAQRQGHLRRDRRARGRLRPHALDQPLAHRAARGRARGHGPHAALVFRARLRLLPLVVAAGRRRADLRRALAGRARR